LTPEVFRTDFAEHSPLNKYGRKARKFFFETPSSGLEVRSMAAKKAAKKKAAKKKK
jgi:hypothetical protein